MICDMWVLLNQALFSLHRKICLQTVLARKAGAKTTINTGFHRQMSYPDSDLVLLCHSYL